MHNSLLLLNDYSKSAFRLSQQVAEDVRRDLEETMNGVRSHNAHDCFQIYNE